MVGRLEEYTSSTLSLLPVSLRRQLLLRLPVADLCRLDGDTAVMNGMNNEALWREVLRERIKFKTPLMLGELLKKHVTAKDTYLNEVSYCLLTTIAARGDMIPQHEKKETIVQSSSQMWWPFFCMVFHLNVALYPFPHFHCPLHWMSGGQCHCDMQSKLLK